MVPGSTLRYGPNFIRLTLIPRLSSRHPIEAAANPLPNEDTTPPVTKMYFADIVSSSQLCLENCAGWGARSIMTEQYAEGNEEIYTQKPRGGGRPSPASSQYGRTGVLPTQSAVN